MTPMMIDENMANKKKVLVEVEKKVHDVCSRVMIISSSLDRGMCYAFRISYPRKRNNSSRKRDEIYICRVGGAMS